MSDDARADRTLRDWLALGAISVLFLVPAVLCFVLARVDLDEFTIGWVVYAMGAGLLGCAVVPLERRSNVGAILAALGFWLALVGAAAFSFLEPDTALSYYRQINDEYDRGESTMTTVYFGAVVMLLIALGGPLAYCWAAAGPDRPRPLARNAADTDASLFDVDQPTPAATPLDPPTHQERRSRGRFGRRSSSGRS